MDIEYEEEENQSFSEGEDELQNQKNELRQCGLLNIGKKVRALYENSNFTDITLTFPGADITYDAHRLILAISSPVFEGILYGPMRTEGRNVLLHEDDPSVMEYVIAHCYGYDLDISDMNTTLEVYKLADKYMLEGLKQECYRHIVNQIDSENSSEVVEFAERFNFAEIKSNCIPIIKEMCEEALKSYEKCEDEPDNTSAFRFLISLNNTWIEGLLSELELSRVCLRNLDFQESWKHPQIPLEDNRIRTILSSRGVCYLNKFYGCVNAECIQQFPLTPFEALELCLSVTGPHHGKRVIDAINQQHRFESNMIALHIRCEEVWPRNWSPIQPERTHRPSLLLISDADDDKTTWIVEAAKAFLPQCEGSYNKVFQRFNFEEEYDNDYSKLKPRNILFLPRSNFTPNGFLNLLQELSTSKVKCKMIIFQSPNINFDHKERIYGSMHTLVHRGFKPRLEMVLKDYNMFRNVFEQIPKTYV